VGKEGKVEWEKGERRESLEMSAGFLCVGKGRGDDRGPVIFGGGIWGDMMVANCVHEGWQVVFVERLCVSGGVVGDRDGGWRPVCLGISVGG
jgi:hypothetical protein